MKKYIYGLAATLIAVFIMSAGSVTHNYGIIGTSDVCTSLGQSSGVAVWDSLTAPDTATYYFEIKGSKDVVTLAMIIDEYGSGTVAGTVTVKGAINYNGSSTWYSQTGIKYKSLYSDTLADGDTEHWLVLGTADYRYIQVQIITSGSSTVRTQAWALVRD